MSLALESVYDLKGRIAVVTGGGTGIGYMIAQGLAVNGMKVYITGRRKEVLQKAAAELPNNSLGSMHVIQMDVTDKASILAGAKEIEEKEGKLHLLVNNSGQVGPVAKFFNDLSAPEHNDPGALGKALFEHESFDDWSKLYATNTFSIYFTSTAFLGLLAKGSEDSKTNTSTIVNITSVSGIMGLAQNHFAYNSGKAASSHLSKSMATEFALKKVPVRVNSIAPGVYGTEMTTHSMPDPTSATEEETNAVGQSIVPIPAGRPGSAQEMAGTIIYLASPAGAYVNGQELVVDGGFIAVNP